MYVLLDVCLIFCVYSGDDGSQLFTDVEAVIYVLDVKSRECEKDMDDYKTCLFEQIIKYSPTAKVFCLVHQMDLIPENKREMVIKTENLVIK